MIAIRQWCHKFAQAYANQIRRKRPKPSDKWHLDEVVIKIKGKQYYLWRAVDKDGQVIDILMQSRRNEAAANKFFRKLLKRYCQVNGNGNQYKGCVRLLDEQYLQTASIPH